MNSEKRKAKRNRASTHSNLFADSQCARAVAANSGGNGDVAVCANDGSVTIRDGSDLTSVKKEI